MCNLVSFSFGSSDNHYTFCFFPSPNKHLWWYYSRLLVCLNNTTLRTRIWTTAAAGSVLLLQEWTRRISVVVFLVLEELKKGSLMRWSIMTQVIQPATPRSHQSLVASIIVDNWHWANHIVFLLLLDLLFQIQSRTSCILYAKTTIRTTKYYAISCISAAVGCL